MQARKEKRRRLERESSRELESQRSCNGREERKKLAHKAFCCEKWVGEQALTRDYGVSCGCNRGMHNLFERRLCVRLTHYQRRPGSGQMPFLNCIWSVLLSSESNYSVVSYTFQTCCYLKVLSTTIEDLDKGKYRISKVVLELIEHSSPKCPPSDYRSDEHEVKVKATFWKHAPNNTGSKA